MYYHIHFKIYELLIEEQKAQQEKLANIEATLKAIENSLSNMK